MRSEGVIINYVPNIHYEDPVDDDVISFEHFGLRITLQLNDVFSHFHTIAPTERDIH